MRVLLANTTCKAGGVSTFLLSLRAALRADGHTVDLFFFEGGSMASHFAGDPSVHFGDLTACLRAVDRLGIDVVHANNVDWMTGISAVRACGARLVVTAHKVRENGTYGWMRSNCDRMTAVARWIAADLQPFTDVPITVVHNGVDTARFAPSHARTVAPSHLRSPIVAWIGRGGSGHKRLDRFAAVAPLLRAAGIRVWVIDQHGPGALADLYGQPTADLLGGSAERWEGVPFERMPDLYREVAASRGCVISTSQSEGLPLTLLEAQASGAIVIASDVRGNNECVLPETGGILYPQDLEPEALARLVTTRLEDAAAAADGMRGAALVEERFSVTRAARQYVALYEGSGGLASRRSDASEARARLSPLRHWDAYKEYRWTTGHLQYQVSRQLTATSEWRLAAAAARTSLNNCPTLFLKPERLFHLCRTLLRERDAKGSLTMLNGLLRRFEVTPRLKAPKPCGTDERLDGRKPCQMGWYEFAAQTFRGEEVLDVGCGSGEGLRVLAAQASRAVGIDLDDRLRRPDLNVEIKSIEEVPDKSFDNVVCLDVIEHVTDDHAFVAHLFRVARKAVFVTTPNYTMSRNRHPYHVREYTPAEFTKLFAAYPDVTLYAGSARGYEQAVVTSRARYFLVNALYTYRPTLLAAKVLKRLLRVKVWKHNAALVRLPQVAATTVPSTAAAA